MDFEAIIPPDAEVKRILEAEMPGLTILKMDRQTRWRPQWFMDVEWKGERTKLVLRGERLQEQEQPLSDEVKFHRMLEERGIPVPNIYHWSDALNAVVMSFVPGRQSLVGEEPAVRDRIVDEYVEALAKLHKLDPQPFLDAGIRQTTGSLNQIIKYRETKTRPYPFMEFGIGWIERHPWRQLDRLVPIVSDSGQFHHADGHLQAIIDLEFGGLGDPLEDLTVWRMRDTLIDYGDFHRIYGYYEELTGDTVDMETVKRMHIAACFGNELMFGNAVRDPLPETDLMTYMQWDSETSLMATEALAEYYDMELPTIRVPEPVDLAEAATHGYLVQLLSRLRPEEAYLQEELRRGFRTARHLQRVAEIGDQIKADNLDDIEQVTGQRHDGWRSAEAALEAFVLADREKGEHDRALIWLFHRMNLRTHMLMGPIGSKMATHYVCQRFDGGPRINTADFAAQRQG
ncbi:phosphotransferase [Sphingobium sp. Sx8-8]|uniref:phosphotransferase n=1 Tax=Sphingobium sp. Sx8-8 TaxID=2933617 RepID=UPI001F5845A3|nr:phosphotransferase [Sphingobium sp. Sx8-8]